jgi:hypothetical protein
MFTVIKGKRATDQLDKKVIFSVDILNIVQGKVSCSRQYTPSSVEERENRSSPFAGITQIKFYAWKKQSSSEK